MYKLIENDAGISYAGEVLYGDMNDNYIILKPSSKSEVCICFHVKYVKKVIDVLGIVQEYTPEKSSWFENIKDSDWKIIHLKQGITYKVLESNFHLSEFHYKDGKWYQFANKSILVWIPNKEVENIFEE